MSGRLAASGLAGARSIELLNVRLGCAACQAPPTRLCFQPLRLSCAMTCNWGVHRFALRRQGASDGAHLLVLVLEGPACSREQLSSAGWSGQRRGWRQAGLQGAQGRHRAVGNGRNWDRGCCTAGSAGMAAKCCGLGRLVRSPFRKSIAWPSCSSAQRGRLWGRLTFDAGATSVWGSAVAAGRLQPTRGSAAIRSGEAGDKAWEAGAGAAAALRAVARAAGAPARRRSAARAACRAA